MKTLILTCLFGFSSFAMADLGTPLDAVKKMIRGANAREIVGVNLEQIEFTADQILQFFNDVDADKAIFIGMGEGEQAWWKHDKSENIHLRMTNPRCIGFEVRFVKDEALADKGYYEVVKIQL